MSSDKKLEEVLSTLQQGYDAGQLAHAYIVVGAPRGVGSDLVQAVLQMFFEGTAETFNSRVHPDIQWVEPESKSRIITVDQLRVFNQRIAQTAAGGGWKVGIFVHADRMGDGAANAFLKTLEEPPGQSLLLLLTDQPQRLLPTILSRCQRLVLSDRAEDPMKETAAWTNEVLDLLRRGAASSPVQAIGYAEQLSQLLDRLKKEMAGENEEALPGGEIDKKKEEARTASRVAEVLGAIMNFTLMWHRDVLMCTLGVDREILHFSEEETTLRSQASHLSRVDAMRNVQAVEAAARQLERNLRPQMAFQTCFMKQMDSLPRGC